jgi:carotenoid cleavage dioxygenase
VRWTFDLAGASDTIKREPLDDLPGEFPRFDERRAGLSYRHGWFAVGAPEETKRGFGAIAHVDLQTGKRTSYAFGDADGAGEPIFVPRTADADEGDGWVIATVYRAAENRSDLVVFDALDIPAGPIAVAQSPRRVPFGFHGNWRPAV